MASTQLHIMFSDLLREIYTKHWALILTLALVCMGLVWLWPVLSPFFAAALVSYLVTSPSQWLVRASGNRLPYAVSAVVCVLFFFIVFSSVVLLLVPVLISQIELIQTNLPGILASVVTRVVPIINNLFDAGLPVEPQSIRESIQAVVLDNTGSVAQFVGGLFKRSSGSVLGITGFITLVVTASLFMAPAWPSLVRSLRVNVPERVLAKWDPLSVELNTTLAQYLKGVAVVVTFQGVFYAIGLSLVGLNSGWAIGLLAGALSLVPYIGLTLSMVLGILTAILDLQGVTGVLLVVGVFVLGQLIEGFILTPLVVGDKIGLSAISVVFSLALFGALFGLIGVVFALPLAACLKVLLQHQLVLYRRSEFFLKDGA